MLYYLCGTVTRQNKNPHDSMFVLTTGNSPIDQGIWCLVEDSIWCHSGTGVQHHIKSTHKETYGTENSNEYTVADRPITHRKGVHTHTHPTTSISPSTAKGRPKYSSPHLLPHVKRETGSTGKKVQFQQGSNS